MIKYKLICKNCNFSFDSWFASSEEYEKIKKKKIVLYKKTKEQIIEDIFNFITCKEYEELSNKYINYLNSFFKISKHEKNYIKFKPKSLIKN